MQTLLLHIVRAFARLARLNYGVHRLVELTLRNVGGWTLTRSRSQHLFLVNLTNYIDARLFLTGSYEDQVRDQFRQHVVEHGVTIFLDIGANIGLYTVSIGSLPSVLTVYAFEPDLLNRQQLIANVLINNLTEKVQIFDVALSDSSGTSQLYRCTTPKPFDAWKANTGAHSLILNPQWHDSATDVVTRRGDDLFSLSGQRLAIKIDVEGHEVHVLQGMQTLLTANACVLQIESFPTNYPITASMLNSLGYRLVSELGDHNYIFTNI